MIRRFNTTGVCQPDKHYMVEISEKLQKIKKLIADGDYFVMNRARQFGKTTTLSLLEKYLKEQYVVFFISFEGLGESAFADELSFCRGIGRLMENVLKYRSVSGISERSRRQLHNIGQGSMEHMDFLMLSDFFADLCAEAERPVVMMIDEVDQASNYRIFLDFLGLLRSGYLQREQRPFFQSVILAGVYDIKNLKLKIRTDGEHQCNSPWNIATDFRVDMSFDSLEIRKMLTEYEMDWRTGMDRAIMSDLIYDYTSGYPYLVSRICQLMDEQVTGSENFPNKADAWTRAGFLEAVKLLLKESNTLFDDILKKLNDYAELKHMLWNILFRGETYPFNPYDFSINLGMMFGFVKEKQNQVVVANRIFETLLYNLFLSETSNTYEIYGEATRELSQFVVNGMLDMDVVMKKFMEHFTEIYGDADTKFIEENGRRIFLIYLRPIINGTGNYYIEAQTRDRKRTDIIVDYKGIQEIIELKIWHGEEYNRRGEAQLFEYLKFYRKEKGYLLSFNFNKGKKVLMQEIVYEGKRIVEVVV